MLLPFRNLHALHGDLRESIRTALDGKTPRWFLGVRLTGEMLFSTQQYRFCFIDPSKSPHFFTIGEVWTLPWALPSNTYQNLESTRFLTILPLKNSQVAFQLRLHRLLSINAPVLLAGTAGSGKSALLSYLAWERPSPAEMPMDQSTYRSGVPSSLEIHQLMIDRYNFTIQVIWKNKK